MLTSLVTHKSTLEVRLYSSHQDKTLPLTCDLKTIIVPELTIALKLVISPYFLSSAFIREALSLLMLHPLPRGPKWLICPQRFLYIFRMYTKVSRYPTSRCSEMICRTGWSEGMQRRHAGSMSVSFFYKKKTLSRDSLGAGAHLAMPMSYSHKPPNKFCSVHHLNMHKELPWVSHHHEDGYSHPRLD